MQMLLSIDNDKKTPSGKIWAKNEFSAIKGQILLFLNRISFSFPENTLLYANQGTNSTMKAGEYAIYLDYVLLGQLIPVKNPLEDLDNSQRS